MYLIEAAHNPEVAGSNPAPATSKAPWKQGPFAFSLWPLGGEVGQVAGLPSVAEDVRRHVFLDRLRLAYEGANRVLRLGFRLSRRLRLLQLHPHVRIVPTQLRVEPEPSRICDPRIDRQIRQALTEQATNPDAVRGLWERIDREAVDQAPLVPSLASGRLSAANAHRTKMMRLVW